MPRQPRSAPTDFNRQNLHLVWRRRVHLDSGGFVNAVLYRGYPWTVAHDMDLFEAAPWQWFASADISVELEVAQNRTEVLDRVSSTAWIDLNSRKKTKFENHEDYERGA